MLEFFNFVLNDPISETLAITLLHFLWQGLLLSVLLFAGLTTISKKHAELRYLLCLVVLGLTLLVPFGTFLSFYDGADTATSTSTDNVITLSSLHVLSDSNSLLETFLPLLTPMWLAGILYLSLSFALELTKVHGLSKDSVIPADDHVQRLFEQIAQRIGVVRKGRLLISMRVDVPMVIGWVKPVVLLPLSMVNGLTTEQLEMLLAHELAHVRRQDYLVNLIQTFVEILLFFHPCVRWISNQVRVEREYCCDDMALKCCGDARVYATALADAEVLRHGSIPQLAMAATGGDLKSRVLRIIGRHDCAQKYSETWHGIALAGLLAVSFASFLFVAHEGLKHRFASVSGEVEEEHTRGLAEIGQVTSPVFKVLTEAPSQPEVTDAVIESAHVTRAPSSMALSSEMQSVTPELPQIATVSETPVKRLMAVSSAPEMAAESGSVALSEEARVMVETVRDENDDTPSSDVMIAAAKTNAQIDDSDWVATAQRVKPTVAWDTERSLQEGVYNDQHIYTDLYFRRGLVDDKLLDEDYQQSAAVGTRAKRDVKRVSPKAMRSPSPMYPVWAAKRSLEGEVLVSFVVSKSGTVENIHFSGDANKYFKRSVELALRKWRFKPGLINGEKAEMAVNKIFTFSDPDRRAMKVTGSRLARRI